MKTPPKTPTSLSDKALNLTYKIEQAKKDGEICFRISDVKDAVLRLKDELSNKKVFVPNNLGNNIIKTIINRKIDEIFGLELSK